MHAGMVSSCAAASVSQSGGAVFCLGRTWRKRSFPLISGHNLLLFQSTPGKTRYTFAYMYRVLTTVEF